MESGFTSRTFSGVRFALVGFNPGDENKLRSKLLSGGGLDVGQYSENYTHLIVDKLVYDDPVCVAARSSGKVVVTGSWVDHSFDIGMLIDANSVLYRPLKDLNGIPGSKSLVVCLTGYQGQDREDIMTMVGLMGGQFSKPLVANRVTHLICYKFEGEKYELAKRMKKIKLVNHRWLEDCLKNWKLLPEVDYEISGHELELMEASARDSEDEAEDASVKRANTSPLGLRVGTMAAVEMSKSGGKDIPIIQTNSSVQAVSSFGNTSKEKWLSPKKANLSLEAMVSADAVSPLQNHYQRTSTFQDTSTYASTSPVNKTSEQGMGRMASDDSTSIQRSMGNTYTRRTLKRSPDTITDLGDGSSGQNVFLRMDDGGTKASNSNISASKSGSAIKRTRLLEDFDKIDKLHDKMSPQTKFTDGSICSKSLEKVNRINDASIALPASLIVKKLELSSPKNLVPVPTINDPIENGEVSHKSPASVLGTELLSSNVVNIEDAIPSVAPTRAETLENMGLKGASDEIPQISVTESDLFGVKYKPETELPKKKTAPRKSLGTRGRKKSIIQQKGSIYLSGPTPNDELTDCLNKVNAATPVTENDNQEISIQVLNSETVPEKGKYIVSDIEAPMRTEAADKLVDQDKRMGMSLNQDKLMDEAHKADKHDAAEDITMPELELNDGLTKDSSHAAIQLEVDKNKRKCREEGIVEKNSFQSKKKGSSSTAKAGSRSVKVTKKSKKEHDDKANGTAEKDFWDYYGEAKENVAMNDKSGKVSSSGEHSPVMGKQLTRKEDATKDPSDSSMQLEVDQNRLKRRKEATVEKINLQSGKKGSSSTVDSANGTAEKEFWDNYAEEEENVAVNDKSGKDSSGGEHSPVVGKQLTRKEAATKDLSDSAMQQEVDQNKLKRRNEATVEKNSLQSGKKGSSSTVHRANGTAEKDLWVNYTEEKENVAVNDKSGKGSSGGEHGPVVGKQSTRKEAATKDPSDSSMQLEVDQNKVKRKKEAIVKKNSLQSGKKGSSSTVDRANDTAEKDKWGNYTEEKENVAVDDESRNVSSGGEHIPVAEKNKLSRKVAASKKPGDSSMRLEVDKNKPKRRKETTAEKKSIQSGKKGSSSAAEVEKPEVKKTKKSKQEHDDKANETVMKDKEEHLAEERESEPVANKHEKVSSGADQIPVTEKPLASKKATKSAKIHSKADKVTRQISSKSMASRKVLQDQEQEPKYFIVSGPRPQRKEYLQIIKSLKGKCCRDSHQWSYQATHFIATNICRTEKFFAATASGSWILKTDYVADSKEAGKLIPEEPYEWHSSCLNADGAISLEAPRKWRLVREKTGHGALNGLCIVVYGDCFIPSLDTLKRAVKAGDGTVLATAPPYTRFLNENTDFAIISPGMPRVDFWIQEFIRHEIPCVLADYLVEYVCKPGYALDKHVLYNTNSWAERSFNKLQLNMKLEVADKEDDVVDDAASSPSGCSDEEDDVVCEVCGSGERGEVMLICGNEEGSRGCGIGTHIDCCDPPLTQVPQHDWFCSKCSVVTVKPPNKRKKR